VTSSDFIAFKLVRAGAAAPAIEQVVTRSRSFAAALEPGSHAVLLVNHSEHGTDSFLVAPAKSASKAASALAAAVGARAEQCEELPSLSSTACLAVVRARPARHPSRNPQSGADPSELAALFARASQPGQWVAFAVRRPTEGEKTRSRRWWQHRLEGAQTHYHLDPNSLVASIYAGGDDRGELRSLVEQIVATIPGMDVETRAVFPGNSRSAAAILALLGVAGGWAAASYLHHTVLGVLIGILLVLVGAGVASGMFKTPGTRLVAAIVALGVRAIPAPAQRFTPPRRPRKGHTKDGKEIDSPGDYPLSSKSFLFSPAMVVGLVSPQVGRESDVAVTAMRRPPAALLGDIGPMIGWAGEGAEPIHLDASQFWGCLAITGLAGSGKSSLLHALWGWHCLERTNPSGRPGWPGAKNSLVVIEPKPDGVPVWLRYSEAAGDNTIVVSLADPSTPALDFFATPGTDEQRAGAFVEAMVYAWPEGDIQGRSYESLTSVFEAALAFSDILQEPWHELGLPGEADVVQAAHCLLGGYDDDSAVSLAKGLAGMLSGPSDPRAPALRKLGPLFGKSVTPSQRRTATEAARNKTKVLCEAGSWWSPSRERVTWEELLLNHFAVMLATGPTPAYPVSDKLTDHISAMAAFTLRSAIMRVCAGWQAAGRSVSIFVDELATVARSSAEVAAWLRNQGRSYGVRTFFATQYAEQLPEEVRNALLSSETLLAYRQGASMAQRIAALLATRGEGWSPADLTGLEQHTAILLTVVGGQPQPPVPVRIAYWDDDVQRFAADQGYTIGRTSGVPSQFGDDWLSAYIG